MKQVFIENNGRLANQLIAWVRARNAFRHQYDVQFYLDHPTILGKMVLPGTELHRPPESANWPRLKWPEVVDSTEACVWDAADLWENPALSCPPEVIWRWFANVRLAKPVESELSRIDHGPLCVGVHVRHGDYTAVNWEMPQVPMPAFPRAPDSYYLNALLECRSMLRNWKLFLASDGEDCDLEFITKRFTVLRSESRCPVVDFIGLTRCQFIIGSLSTFSHLAAHCGNRPIIFPMASHYEIKQVIRKFV